MASVSIAAIAAALNSIHSDRMTKAFREDSVALSLMEMEQAAPNDELLWSVKFDARTAGGAVADGADMGPSDFDHHKIERAHLPWSIYRSGVQINDGALDVASQRGNGFDGELLNSEISDAIGKIRKDLGTHIFSGQAGASPTQLSGLAEIVSDADDDYAGIITDAVTGTPEWAGHVDALSSSYTLDDLHAKVIRPVQDHTGRRPDYLLCDGTQMDYIAGLLDTAADTMQAMIAAGPYGYIQSQFGSRVVIVKGVPVVEDRFATTKTIYGITRSAWRLRYIPVATPPVANAEVAAAIERITGGQHLPSEAEVAERLMAQQATLAPVLIPLAKNGLSLRLMLRTPQIQVQVRDRGALSKAVVA